MVATWGQTSLQKPLRHHARHRRQGCSRPPPTTWRSLFSMCSLIRTAPLFPPISVALLLLFQVPSATAQIHALSSSFQRARLCLAAGGILDLYGHDYGGLEGPYCLSSGSCPAGSVQIEQQCVAPNAGQPREIALTIHVPCNSCVYDSGVELSGHLWLAVSRMLRVPVQETAAGVLIMRSDMRSVYPVEHFTLAPRDASPMVDGPGRLGPVTLSRDLLLAFRIHTSRVPSNSYALQALRQRSTALLVKVAGPAEFEGYLHLFEFVDRSVSWVRDTSGLSSRFKLQGYDWDEQPSYSGSTAPRRRRRRAAPLTRNPTPRPTRRPTRSPTPPPSRLVCDDRCWYLLHDGYCDHHCNTEACNYDGGDCVPTPAPWTMPPTSLAASSCRCLSIYLGDGRCDLPCDTEACEFDRGDCDVGSATPSPTQPLTLSPSRAPTTASAVTEACGCSIGLIGNGICDEQCYTEDCDFDGGDCAGIPGKTKTPSLRGSDDSNGAEEDSEPYVINLRVESDPDGGNSFRAVAQDSGGAQDVWYIDQARGAHSTDQSMDAAVSAAIAAALFAVAVFLGICAFCRSVQKSQARALEVHREELQKNAAKRFAESRAKSSPENTWADAPEPAAFERSVPSQKPKKVKVSRVHPVHPPTCADPAAVSAAAAAAEAAGWCRPGTPTWPAAAEVASRARKFKGRSADGRPTTAGSQCGRPGGAENNLGRNSSQPAVSNLNAHGAKRLVNLLRSWKPSSKSFSGTPLWRSSSAPPVASSHGPASSGPDNLPDPAEECVGAKRKSKSEPDELPRRKSTKSSTMSSTSTRASTKGSTPVASSTPDAPTSTTSASTTPGGSRLPKWSLWRSQSTASQQGSYSPSTPASSSSAGVPGRRGSKSSTGGAAGGAKATSPSSTPTSSPSAASGRAGSKTMPGSSGAAFPAAADMKASSASSSPVNSSSAAPGRSGSKSTPSGSGSNAKASDEASRPVRNKRANSVGPAAQGPRDAASFERDSPPPPQPPRPSQARAAKRASTWSATGIFHAYQTDAPTNRSGNAPASAAAKAAASGRSSQASSSAGFAQQKTSGSSGIGGSKSSSSANSSAPRQSAAAAAQASSAGWSAWLSGKPKAQTGEQIAETLISDMTNQMQRAKGESLEERKKVFKELQRQLHPDKNMDSVAHQEGAKLAFQRLMEQRSSFLSP